MKNFNIGDRVEIVPNGEFGVITDILFSKRSQCTLYEVGHEDGDGIYGSFCADDLEPAPIPKEYSMSIQVNIADNVVVATLLEVSADGSVTSLRRGHGHIIHDGEKGIAQAASYACKRLYDTYCPKEEWRRDY